MTQQESSKRFFKHEHSQLAKCLCLAYNDIMMIILMQTKKYNCNETIGVDYRMFIFMIEACGLITVVF